MCRPTNSSRPCNRGAQPGVQSGLRANLFITTTLFNIAGLISRLGTVDRVQAMVSGIGFIAVSSRETLELRLLVLIGIFVFAFFKFTWSLRQFTHADAVRLGADAGVDGCPGRRRAG